MDNGAGSYRRYLDGEEAAFDEIIKEYFDKLVFFLSRYLPERMEAEDVAMDVFAYLLIYPRRYDFSVSLKTYLFMLGKSRALNRLRRLQRQQALGEREGETATQPPEDRLLEKESHRQLHRAIDGLPQLQQAVIHLVYFEDLSCEEAARVLKKSRKQVYNLLYRAKEQLKTVLKEELDERF